MSDSDTLSTGRPRIRRLVGIAITIGLLGAAGFGIYTFFIADDGGTVTAAKTQEATVTKGRLVSSFTTTGTAQVSLTSKLTFKSGGQVRAISVGVGDKVANGQELARLDDRDAKRAIDTAATNLATAQLRLQQLQQPPTDSDLAASAQSIAGAQAALINAQSNLAKLTAPSATDVASAAQSVAAARGQLLTAQGNLDTATQPPAAADLAAAQASVTSSTNAIQAAQNTLDSASAAFLGAERTYCNTAFVITQYYPCVPNASALIGPMPIPADAVSNMIAYLGILGQTPNSNAALATNTNAFVAANSNYINAVNGLDTAKKNLTTAQAKLDALTAGPTATTLAQLRASILTAQAGLDSALAKQQSLTNPDSFAVSQAQAAVVSAQAGLDSARTKQAALIAGPTALDVQIQQQAIKTAQISYQQQLDAMDNLVLHAPFDGIIGTQNLNIGDTVGGATAAMTLANPEAVRVDLTVSEADLQGIKAGQYGLATFDALPGGVYIVKVTGVSTTPVVTQGVTTYPVQALLLRGADLQKNAADLQKVAAALTSLAGGRGGTASRTPAAGGQGGPPPGFPGGGGRDSAPLQAPSPTGTPGAGRPGGTPSAGGTPGAGGNGGAPSGAAGGVAGLLQSLASAPLPAAGMSASVTVILDIKEDALLLPTTAIKKVGRAASVVVTGPDGKPQSKPVTVGGSDNVNTQVLTGLNEGDIVLIGATVPGSTTGTPAAVATRRPTPVAGVR
jgi:multidrug resistance efflux pump